MTVATRCHTIIWQLLTFKNLTYSCKNLTSDDLTKFLLLWSGWAELCQGMTSLSRAVVPRSICSPKNHFAPWPTVRREAEKLSNERDKKLNLSYLKVNARKSYLNFSPCLCFMNALNVRAASRLRWIKRGKVLTGKQNRNDVWWPVSNNPAHATEAAKWKKAVKNLNAR